MGSMTSILTDLSTPALLSAIQANAYAFFLRRERILGKTIREESLITWLEAPSSAPVAWLHQPLTAETVRLRAPEVTADFHSQGLSEVYLVALENGECRPIWQACGASQIETEHAMALSLSGLREVQPAFRGLGVDCVVDTAGLQDCAAVISAGRDQWTAGFFQLTNPGSMIEQESMRYYLARYQDRPVATAAQFFWGGIGGIWWVTTVPDFRRRGLSTAITRAALFDAARLGYRAVMLEALPDAVPMYRRMGFREYCRINVYRWRPNPLERPSG
jgi:GNAT superfamily N-acetyltransferase